MDKFKKYFKNVLVFFISFFILSSIFLAPASAQPINYRIPNPSRYDSLEEVISAAGSLIRPVFLLTFGAFILLGAITLLTSQGEAEKIEKAKRTITTAIIGFVIAVFAPTFANLVLGLVGADNLGVFG